MIATLLLSSIINASSPAAISDKIRNEYEVLGKSFDGKAGICAIADLRQEPICFNGKEAFPLQSVMKLVVATAVFSLVDEQKLKLSDKIKLTPADRSPGPRDFYDLIVKQGSYEATVEELIRRSVNDSDSTAVDALIKHIGGVSVVQKFLASKKIQGVRVDRDEKTLQAEFYGLTWNEKFADPQAFDAAIAAVPKSERKKAIEAYLKDPRDTASAEGMVNFLRNLFTTKILSHKSTETLLLITERTKTGKNRLRAGIPKGWALGNKTGTSASFDGKTATTNDVGVITSPDGRLYPIAVFLSDSKWNDAERGRLMEKAAKIVTVR